MFKFHTKTAVPLYITAIAYGDCEIPGEERRYYWAISSTGQCYMGRDNLCFVSPCPRQHLLDAFAPDAEMARNYGEILDALKGFPAGIEEE